MNIVCCIHDEQAYQQLQGGLARARMVCERLPSELALLRSLRRHGADLIVVEVGAALADNDGFFSWLGCRSGATVPVLLLGRHGGADLVAEALDAGADDFVRLPCDTVELMARLRALQRRCVRTPQQRTIEQRGFVLDREASTLRDHGVEVELTPREFTMAWLFFSSPGVFISRETISVAIWGVGSDVASRTIEQHVYKLRKKLQLGPERGVLLRTAYTQGYRLELGQGADGADPA